MTPMLIVRPPAKPLAIGFGTNPSLAIAASTACFLASLTIAVPFNIRDMVLAETPASRATIAMLTGNLDAFFIVFRPSSILKGIAFFDPHA
jgi:hypothetical protein